MLLFHSTGKEGAVLLPSILKVSQLNRYVKALMEENKLLRDVMVKGELSSVSYRSGAGHYYFTVEEGGCLLDCVMFSRYAEKLHSFPEEGSAVIVRGAVSLYEKEGRFQLIAYDIKTLGQGRGAEDFALLRSRLQKEGLFDPERKLPLPRFPHAVGVITAGEGAAVQDIVTAMARHNASVPVVLYPATVQGSLAVDSMLEALHSALAEGLCDIIILGRGGGSSEDLSVFNDERLVRAAALSPVPVISAVGHDVDYTLLDEAADARAATPTAAAALCGYSSEELLRRVELSAKRLLLSAEKRLAETSARFRMTERLLAVKSPQNSLNRNRQRLSYLVKLLQEDTEHLLWKKRQQIRSLGDRLELLSPEAPLGRGYSLTTGENRSLIRSVKNIKAGDRLVTRLADGEIVSVVLETRAGEGRCDG